MLLDLKIVLSLLQKLLIMQFKIKILTTVKPIGVKSQSLIAHYDFYINSSLIRAIGVLGILLTD